MVIDKVVAVLVPRVSVHAPRGAGLVQKLCIEMDSCLANRQVCLQGSELVTYQWL